MYQQLLDGLVSLQVFGSHYQERLLTELIMSKEARSAIDLSKSLEIPDSKVYPALKELAKLELITVNETVRPKTYKFERPDKLKSYLQQIVETRYKNHQDTINEITEKAESRWEPDEFVLDNIAQIYRGKDLYHELNRHLKLTRERLFVFLSQEFDTYYELLAKYIIQVSHDDFRLHLVVPPGQQDFLQKIEKDVRGKIKLKTSIWNQNSYIIRDEQVMMNIFHSDEDVGLLTNDRLLVRNIKSCWDDPTCCTSADPVQLELPENFEFSTIKLP